MHDVSSCALYLESGKSSTHLCIIYKLAFCRFSWLSSFCQNGIQSVRCVFVRALYLRASLLIMVVMFLLAFISTRFWNRHSKIGSGKSSTHLRQIKFLSVRCVFLISIYLGADVFSVFNTFNLSIKLQIGASFFHVASPWNYVSALYMHVSFI